FVEAARSLGAGDLRIMFVDILPNLIAQVIVYLTMLIPAAVVFEAVLSFPALGVVPPTATWGNMLSESLGYYRVAWWFVFFPGAALLTTTLAFNLLGDSVRVAFDSLGERVFRTLRMLFFLVRRILLGLVVLWAITTVVFVMFFVAPSHVAQLIAGRPSPPERGALVPHGRAPDLPILTQYFNYLRHLLHGDLGYSYYNSET